MGNADFARVCWLYLTATDEQREATLALLNDEEKEAFLLMVGYFRILVDKEYHDKIMAETMRQYLLSLESEVI